MPLVLHEANCVPGKAVRLLKRVATRLYLPDGVRMKVPPERVRYLGYPVRREIVHILKAEAWQRLGIEVPGKLLVVIGGSQGAEALNQWVTEHFETLAEAGVSLYCVTGLGWQGRKSYTMLTVRGRRLPPRSCRFPIAWGM